MNSVSQDKLGKLHNICQIFMTHKTLMEMFITFYG